MAGGRQCEPTRPCCSPLPLRTVHTPQPGGGHRQRSGFGVEVLIDGRPVHRVPGPRHALHRGLKGREYAIRLRNPLGVRVAVALSVDGLNTIDAKRSTAHTARKWVLGPYETVVISGWQTSSSQARQFFFTSEEQSYAQWLGQDPRHGHRSARCSSASVSRGRAADVGAVVGCPRKSAADDRGRGRQPLLRRQPQERRKGDSCRNEASGEARGHTPPPASAGTPTTGAAGLPGPRAAPRGVHQPALRVPAATGAARRAAASPRPPGATRTGARLRAGVLPGTEVRA